MKKKINALISVFLLISSLAVLAHCGGGGGSAPPPDMFPPTVISTSPNSGTTDVAVNSSILVSFSEQVDPSTVNGSTLTLKDSGNNQVNGVVSCSGSTATITPQTNLDYSATYTITVLNGISDLNGNIQMSDYTCDFTTGAILDNTPPTVLSTTPTIGSSSIAVNTTITVFFSKSMSPATLDNSTFKVEDDSSNPVSGTITYSGTAATFTPDTNLDFSTTYTATITTGAQDLAGNAITSNYTWNFTTEVSYTFTVSTIGTGSGSISSTPPGIDCGIDCTEAYISGTNVTLTATPDAGSIFEGFSGGCNNIQPTCDINISGDTTVTAIFNTDTVSAAGNQLGLNGIDDVAVHQQTINPPTSALDLSTFTIEAWVFPLANSNMIIAADSAYYLMIKPQAGGTPLRVEFAVMTTSGFPASMSFAGTINPLQLNQWNHIAGIYNNTTKELQLTVNGELSTPFTAGEGMSASLPQTFSVGNFYPKSLGDYPFIGRIDEVRLSSTLRYLGNFTPPSLFSSDVDVVGLWHFDEAEGAATFADSSGNSYALSAIGDAATITGSRGVNQTALYSWQKITGNTGDDSGNSVIETSDGSFIVAGTTDSFGAGGNDVYLIKTGAAGNFIWDKTFGGTGNDSGNSVVETSDGGFIVTGGTDSSGAGDNDVYLIKTDAAGNLIWEKTFGGTDNDEGNSVVETSDGGFIVTGGTDSSGAGDYDVYLIKTNSSGTLLWEKTFGGTSDDIGSSVIEASDGSLIVAGSSYTGDTNYFNVYLIKTTSDGGVIWNKTFGGTDQDLGFSVAETSDGGFVVTGFTLYFATGYRDIYLLRTDVSGNLTWEKRLGGTYNDESYSVAETSDEGFIITGYTIQPSFSNDLYLIKTDASGNISWQKTFGGSNDDAGKAVAEASDGGFIITGYTSSYGGGLKDVYLIKTDENGNVP